MKACYTPTRSHVPGKQADTRASPVGRSGLKGSKFRACRKEAPRAGTGRYAEPETLRAGVPALPSRRSSALRQDPFRGSSCFSVWGAPRQPRSPGTDHSGMLTPGPSGLCIPLCRVGTTPRGHIWPKRLPIVSHIHQDCGPHTTITLVLTKSKR